MRFFHLSRGDFSNQIGNKSFAQIQMDPLNLLGYMWGSAEASTHILDIIIIAPFLSSLTYFIRIRRKVLERFDFGQREEEARSRTTTTWCSLVFGTLI